MEDVKGHGKKFGVNFRCNRETGSALLFLKDHPAHSEDNTRWEPEWKKEGRFGG